MQAAIDNDADIICCSALLTTTMSEMKARRGSRRGQKGIRDKVKIMVGGAPVTQSFCDSIGADCYTADAASCGGRSAEALRGIIRKNIKKASPSGEAFLMFSLCERSRRKAAFLVKWSRVRKDVRERKRRTAGSSGNGYRSIGAGEYILVRKMRR